MMRRYKLKEFELKALIFRMHKNLLGKIFCTENLNKNKKNFLVLGNGVRA